MSPINYRLYPKNWKSEIRPAILERAKHCCEMCGVANYDIGYRDKKSVWYPIEHSMQGDVDADDARSDGYKIIKIVLTIAHLDHDITNNDPSNLKALCQKCHLSLDSIQHRENARKTIQNKKGLQSLF